jgi:ADP-ribose pyrophosphatase YjhB (NUDIX family)
MNLPYLFVYFLIYNSMMMKKQNRIRVKALAWLQQDDALFVVKMHDSVKGDEYYRPIGGTVEFGETTRDTLQREVKEELGTTINITGDPLIFENLFTCDGERGHEIDYLYPASFTDPAFMEERVFPLLEANDASFDAEWIELVKFLNDELRLVPEALLDWYRSGNAT